LPEKITMRRFLIILIINIVWLSTAAQKQREEQPEIQTIEETEYENGLKISPKYPEGDEAFKSYLINSIRRIKLKNPQKIYVYFIVEKDGSLSNIEFSEGTDVKVQERISKALKKCKKWEAGVNNGRLERCRYKYPLTVNGKN
jgi:hypothetical protein